MAETQCEGQAGPTPFDSEGNPIETNSSTTPGCTTVPGTERTCSEKNKDLTCRPFQFIKNRDACFIDSVINESLNIGGAVFNVYKLLGVHEQGRLVDVTGRGQAISNGDLPGFPASNAFDAFVTEWRSVQVGDAVTASSFIGYDFGEIKTNDDSRNAYGITANVRKHVKTFAIKQSSNQNNRATRARLEWSDDGSLWRGAAVINLPDDDCLNTIFYVSNSAPARFWRLRPILFNGSSSDFWSVQAFQMFNEYEKTDPDNIQDKIFVENRDRDYSDEPIVIKGFYDLVEPNTELTKIGMELPDQMIYMSINFNACVEIIGRPLVIGDIIEIPSEAQFSAKLERIRKWVEVTDVAWSAEGFTPNWQPTLLRVVAEPALATQETQDLFGDLAEEKVDDTNLYDGFDGNHPIYQDYADVNHTIEADAKSQVPERGREGSSTIRQFEQEELDSAAEQGLDTLNRIGLNPIGLYTEDAMPPNNEPFTEGDEFPESPSHGDYHRLTYSGLSKDVPPRLYRYSESKERWIFLETDLRYKFDPTKPFLQEFLESPTRTPHTRILRDEEDH